MSWKGNAKGLLPSMERLEQALEANDRGAKAWAERVDGALADVERVLNQQRAQWYTPDSPFQAIDVTRPTLARQAAKLRLVFVTALVEAAALRAKFKSLAAGPAASAAPEASPPLAGARLRGRTLLDALRRCHKDEANLVLESVNMDFGAGD